MNQPFPVDDRIKILLSGTNLTFQQIVDTLRLDNISASLKTVRRVNRIHRCRKPRFEAKLTPLQRRELIKNLKNNVKPDLAALAKHYGVSHGSIYYWWDKIKSNKVKKNNAPKPSDVDSLLNNDYKSNEHNSLLSEGSSQEDGNNRQGCSSTEYKSNKVDLYEFHPDPLNLSTCSNLGEESAENSYDFLVLDALVGRVEAKDLHGNYIRLPIVMYSSNSKE